MWSLSIQYLQKCLLIFLIIAKNVYSFPSIMSEKYNLEAGVSWGAGASVDLQLNVKHPEKSR